MKMKSKQDFSHIFLRLDLINLVLNHFQCLQSAELDHSVA